MLHFCLAIIFAAVIHSYANVCEFNGSNYGVGDKTTETCMVLECNADGSWTGREFSQECNICALEVTSVINLHGFDQSSGSFHELNATPCSYSFAQDYESGSSVEETYDPYPAVFVGLDSCADDASILCFDSLTFRVNTDLEIRFFLDQPNKLLINNISIQLSESLETLSVNGNKIPVVALGAGGGVAMTVPQISVSFGGAQLSIILSSAFQGHLAGLCGYFDGDEENDLLFRNGTTSDLDKDAFTASWLTKEQDKCESPVPAEEETSCTDSEEVAQTCISLLASAPNLHSFIGICTSVLCNDPENGQLIIQAALKTPSLMFRLLTMV